MEALTQVPSKKRTVLRQEMHKTVARRRCVAQYLSGTWQWHKHDFEFRDAPPKPLGNEYSNNTTLIYFYCNYPWAPK